MYKFKSIKEIKDAVSKARYDGLDKAHDECGRRGYLRSIGTLISTVDNDGQCNPCPSAASIYWKGTNKEIEKLVSLCLAQYPNVTKIYIEGGYYYADSVRSYYDDDFDPDIHGYWEVVVWERS